MGWGDADRESDWRAINFLARHDKATGTVEAMSSTWMNVLLPSLCNDPPVLSTWNPLTPPDPASVVAETNFERPLVTLETDEALAVRALAPAAVGVVKSKTNPDELAVRDLALQKLWKVQGTNRRYFIGAYAGGGIPLLEGCVDSGLRVGKMFGVDDNLVYRVAKVRPGRSSGSVSCKVLTRSRAGTTLPALRWPGPPRRKGAGSAVHLPRQPVAVVVVGAGTPDGPAVAAVFVRQGVLNCANANVHAN